MPAACHGMGGAICRLQSAKEWMIGKRHLRARSLCEDVYFEGEYIDQGRCYVFSLQDRKVVDYFTYKHTMMWHNQWSCSRFYCDLYSKVHSEGYIESLQASWMQSYTTNYRGFHSDKVRWSLHIQLCLWDWVHPN